MLFLCQLWPWLAGGLLGWLLCGWLARRLKYGEPPVEKIVEKTVEVEKVIDNPKHLSLISQLENENRQIADLKMRVSAFEKSEADMADLIKKEGGSANGGLRSQFTHLISGFRTKISDSEDKAPEVIEKEVEKVVDNPDLLKRIKLLEEENANISGLRTTIIALENRKPTTIEKVIEKEVEKQVDNPQHLTRIKLLEDEISNWKRGPSIDLPAARAAGIIIKAEDDFTAIEGIGPKISELIHAEGIHSFKSLSETDPARIQKVLDQAGANYQMANPGTWPDQANLAASNRWPALKALQDILDGGVYPDLAADREATSANSSSDAAKIKGLESELTAWKRGAVIDMAAARSAGLTIKAEDDFTAIEGIGPKISELIHADGIHTFKELSEVEPARIQTILDKAGASFQMANPGTWPDQANLAASNRWPALKALQDILDGGIYPDLSAQRALSLGESADDAAKIQSLETELAAYRFAETQTASVADIEAAKAAGFKIRRQGDRDDFTIIEGIGPKIDELIHAENIHTYSQLAATSTAVIQKILDAAGPNFVLAEPDTWPAQSGLAAKNQWIDLMKWQDELDGGKE